MSLQALCSSIHSAQISKDPYADSGAEHSAPVDYFACSDLGLKSSWPAWACVLDQTLGLRFVLPLNQQIPPFPTDPPNLAEARSSLLLV